MDLRIVTAYHVMVAPKFLQMVFAADALLVVMFVMGPFVLPVYLDFYSTRVIV